MYKGFTHSNLETYSIYPWVKNPSQCTTMDRENILELGRHKCKIRATMTQSHIRCVLEELSHHGVRVTLKVTNAIYCYDTTQFGWLLPFMEQLELILIFHGAFSPYLLLLSLFWINRCSMAP